MTKTEYFFDEIKYRHESLIEDLSLDSLLSVVQELEYLLRTAKSEEEHYNSNED